LGSNAEVTVNRVLINQDELFDFDNDVHRYCVSTDTRPPIITISFPSSVLVIEIGIRGSAGLTPSKDQFIRSFSLAYVDGDNFVNYTRANDLTVCSILHCT